MNAANLLSALTNHLWQSTVFAAVIWLLALALRKNQARTRHWLWLAASIKFLAPFALFMAIGALWSPKIPTAIIVSHIPGVATQLVLPFPENTTARPLVAVSVPHDAQRSLLILFGIWACGFAGITFSWWLEWRRVRAAVRTAAPLTLPANVPVLNSPTSLEPGIFGILRPVLLLPKGIADRLTAEQLDAIIAHEMCHVRRRDNLAAAIHMFVEAIFWFHPIVWWIGARLVEERERACDEEVLRLGGQREAYAEGILNVCKYYVESPVACVSGISGSDLKKRIVRIMTQRGAANLTLARKFVLAAVGVAAIAGPLLFGAINSPLARARQQESTPLPSFEVASIKLDDSGARGRMFQMPSPGRLRTVNISAKQLVEFAYNIKDFQLSGGPSWIDGPGYAIDAKVDDSTLPEFQKLTRREQNDQIKLMTRSLLADRFKLVVSHETKELPIFALVVAKGGPKLTPTKWVEPDSGTPPPSTPPANAPHLMLSRDKITAVNQPMSGLADLLALMPDLGGRMVVDQTGIKGNYDFEIHFTSEAPAKNPMESAPADDSAPSIFTALEEQMGLKLDTTKGPVDTYTIEHIEQPSDN
jgi:bla regulator protein BlaR1